VDTLLCLDFENILKLKKLIYDKYSGDNYDMYGDFQLRDFYGSTLYYDFGTYNDKTDILFIYGKSDYINKLEKLDKQILQKEDNENETFDYPYPNHISITIIGGKLLKVINIQTQKEVVLNPIVGALEQSKAYLKDNMLITEFLLPKDGIYKIELQKLINSILHLKSMQKFQPMMEK